MKRYTLAWFRSVIYWKTANLIDAVIDIFLTGHRLAKKVENVSGSNGTYPTRYLVLRHIFSDMVTLTEHDSIIDIGCGMGRVLAYLGHKYPHCQLTGVDFNEASIAVARKWTAKKERINIYCQDALTLDYSPYTIVYLFRPFPPEIFIKFIELLEMQLDHPIKMIYMSDQESGHYLRNREGWRMLLRKKIFKLNGLQAAASPQGCSVWMYTPASV